MTSTRILAAILVMQSLVLVGQWVNSPSSVVPAYGQIPDAGNQRLQMIDEQKATNAKLDKLISIFESGNLQVKVVPADEKR